MKAYPTLDGTPLPAPRKRSRWRHFVERQLPSIVIFLMVLTLMAVVLYPYMVVSVPSAQVGVLWKRFGGGTQLDRTALRGEGCISCCRGTSCSCTTCGCSRFTETYHAITRDGVNIGATINVRFQLQREFVPKLHVAAGPDYLNLLVRPEIGSRVREVIAEFTAEEVYSTKRQEIQDLGRERTKKMMGEMAEREGGEQQRIRLNETLNIYDVLILGIELPAVVVAAINRKIEQYYIAEEYKFRVERERRESERKQIEAVGIRNFQQTVAQGISDSYLRWRGIEATLQLAQSTNSKVVIVGGGKDGLPIILGNVDSAVTAATGPGRNAAGERSGARAHNRVEPRQAAGKDHRIRPDRTNREAAVRARRRCGVSACIEHAVGIRHAALVMAVEPARHPNDVVQAGARRRGNGHDVRPPRHRGRPPQPAARRRRPVRSPRRRRPIGHARAAT